MKASLHKWTPLCERVSPRTRARFFLKRGAPRYIRRFQIYRPGVYPARPLLQGLFTPVLVYFLPFLRVFRFKPVSGRNDALAVVPAATGGTEKGPSAT